MKKNLVLLMISIVTTVSIAQRKVITHDDYNRWMKMGETQLSEKGSLIVYEVEPITPFVNPFTEVYNTKTKTYFKLDKGINPKIDFDENFVFFQQKPSFEAAKKIEKTYPSECHNFLIII